MPTDLSDFSEAELEALAAQKRAQQQPPVTQVPGWAAPVVAPALPFLALSDMARGKSAVSPPAPGGGASAFPTQQPPSGFPSAPIYHAPPDPTYNPDPSFVAGNPVGQEFGFGRFGTRAWEGLGKFATDVPLMLNQWTGIIGQNEGINKAIDTALPPPFSVLAQAVRGYGKMQNMPALQALIEEKRHLDEPLAGTAGGKFGQFVGQTAAMAALGPFGTPGAMASGAIPALSQLSTNPAEIAADIGISEAATLGTRWLANKLGAWAQRRGQEPIAGWTKGSFNQQFADTVGAKSSNRLDLYDRRMEMGAVFDRARSADIMAQIPQGTRRTVDEAAEELITADPETFRNSALIQRVLAVGQKGQATTEDLGKLTSEIGKKAFSTQNPEVREALFHVEDYLQERTLSAIKDPALRAEYLDTMSKYGLLKRVASNPSMYNPGNGNVDFEAIGKYFQKKETWAYLGATDNPMYRAALAAQGQGITPKPPTEFTKRVGHAVAGHTGNVVGGLTARTMNQFPALGPAALETGAVRLGLGGWSLARGDEEPPKRLPYLEK